MSVQLLGVYHGYDDMVTACYHTTMRPYTRTVQVATKTLTDDYWVKRYYRQLGTSRPYKEVTTGSELANRILDIGPLVRVDFNQIREHEFEVVVCKIPGSSWYDIDPLVIDAIFRSLKWQRKEARVVRYDEFARYYDTGGKRLELGSLKQLLDNGTVGGPHRFRRLVYKYQSGK